MPTYLFRRYCEIKIINRTFEVLGHQVTNEGSVPNTQAVMPLNSVPRALECFHLISMLIGCMHHVACDRHLKRPLCFFISRFKM